jgi:hypothetical protein
MTAAFRVHRRAFLMDQHTCGETGYTSEEYCIACQKDKRKHGRRKPNPVDTLIVHPDVLALALILADRNNRRIIDRTPTSVLVVNHAR